MTDETRQSPADTVSHVIDQIALDASRKIITAADIPSRGVGQRQARIQLIVTDALKQMSDRDLAQLRIEQADAVMPLIGGLLDQWEGMSNDAKSSLRWENPTLCEYLDKIDAAMEGGQ